jgi:hypothetical protein
LFAQALGAQGATQACGVQGVGKGWGVHVAKVVIEINNSIEVELYL